MYPSVIFTILLISFIFDSFIGWLSDSPITRLGIRNSRNSRNSRNKSFFIIAITTKYIIKAYKSSYRLPTSVYHQDTEVKLFGSEGSIMLDKVSAKYVNDLKSIAINSEWTEETPLIDLIGGSPFAFTILNADLVGAWAGGAYPGSDDFTRQAISLSKINPLQCWILTAPNGARAISSEVLLDEYYNFEDNFQLVGKVKTGHRNELQLLWKPRNIKNYKNGYKN